MCQQDSGLSRIGQFVDRPSAMRQKMPNENAMHLLELHESKIRPERGTKEQRVGWKLRSLAFEGTFAFDNHNM